MFIIEQSTATKYTLSATWCNISNTVHQVITLLEFVQHGLTWLDTEHHFKQK